MIGIISGYISPRLHSLFVRSTHPHTHHIIHTPLWAILRNWVASISVFLWDHNERSINAVKQKEVVHSEWKPSLPLIPTLHQHPLRFKRSVGEGGGSVSTINIIPLLKIFVNQFEIERVLSSKPTKRVRWGGHSKYRHRVPRQGFPTGSISTP